MCTLITGPVSHSCQRRILAPSEMGEKEFLKLTLFSARRGHFVREKINKKRKLCGRDKKRESIKLHRRGPSSPPTHSQAQPAKKNGGFRHRLNGATHNSRMLSTAVWAKRQWFRPHSGEGTPIRKSGESKQREEAWTGGEEEFCDTTGISSSITLQTGHWFVTERTDRGHPNVSGANFSSEHTACWNHKALISPSLAPYHFRFQPLTSPLGGLLRLQS